MRIFATLIGLVLVACGPPPKLVAQDVSFLIPLDQARTFLPGPQVLPRAHFDRLDPLTVVDEPDALFGALGVVSVRLDACFQEGAMPGACQPQVRLVLQPVFDEAGLTTRDAAVHIFFSNTTSDVVKAVRALAEARESRGVKAGDELTDVHPGFADAAWVKTVKAQLLPLLADSRIVRVTSMSVHASNQAWQFSGTDYVDGQPMAIRVPTLQETHAHVTSTGGTAALAVTLTLPTPAEPALAPILAPGGLERATPAEVAAAITSVQRLEDPAIHNPGTVDCASCHVAALAQRAFSKRGLAIEVPIPAPSAFDDTQNLRAFGFFFAAPAISPRVHRETLLVRDDFTQRLEH